MTDKLVEILDAKGVRTKPLVTDLYVRLDVNEFGFERVDGHNPDVVDAFAPGMDAAIVGLGN